MFDHDPIPRGLDTMPPGPALGGLLASIDVDRVSPHHRVIVLRAWQRQTSHGQAQMLAAMSALADHFDTEFPHDPHLGWQAASTEIRAAQPPARRSADTQFDLAELGWRHQPLPGGDHLWISPLGHRYTTSGHDPP